MQCTICDPARAMKQRTALRSKPGVMPPWYIEKNVGIQQFKDDISLSDEEIERIAVWADSGAPRGDPADMPPPLVFPGSNVDSVWKIGKRVLKRKAKGAAPSVEGGKPNKSLLGFSLAGIAGALMFWRKKRGGESST